MQEQDEDYHVEGYDLHQEALLQESIAKGLTLVL